MPEMSTTERVHRNLYKTYDEAIAECVDKEVDAMAVEAQLGELAEVLWPEACERPEFHEGIEVASLVAGVRSLHELNDRLYAENEALRERLREASRG